MTCIHRRPSKSTLTTQKQDVRDGKFVESCWIVNYLFDLNRRPCEPFGRSKGSACDVQASGSSRFRKSFQDDGGPTLAGIQDPFVLVEVPSENHWFVPALSHGAFA